MFCTKCGKNIEDGSKFCGFCGATVEERPAFTPVHTNLTVTNASAFSVSADVPHSVPKPKRVRKMVSLKIKIKPWQVVSAVLALCILIGGISFAVTYETPDKALNNIIEGAIFGNDEEELDRYFFVYLIFDMFALSEELNEDITESFEGLLSKTVENTINSEFYYYFEDDDYDLDWEILSKKDADLDDEEFKYADIMKTLIERGYISTVFHPVILLDAVEYEIKVTAQEGDEKISENFRIVLVNYNMKWYYRSIETVD